jgi:3-phenylpropionate/cinnamic acid dioxygenase small subunit
MDLTRHEAEDFLYYEAQLLDDRRLEEWLELFTEDGIYWLPIVDGADPEDEASVLYDDSNLRAQRVHQLLHEQHFAQIPPSRTVHLITNVQVDRELRDGDAVVRCNLSVDELRPGDHRQLQYGLGIQRSLTGRCEYRLRPRNGRWAIALKKIVLLNCDLPIYNLSFIL